jgi:hypothetical protein
MAFILAALKIVNIQAYAEKADDHSCTVQHGSYEIFANCSRLNLKSIPASLPGNVTTLDLSHNLIANISVDGPLCYYKELRTLDLSWNKLLAVTTWSAFPPSLQVLALSRNDIASVCVNPGQ